MLQSFSLGQIDFHGKLISVCVRELAHLQVREYHTRGCHQNDGAHHGEPRVSEIPVQCAVVDFLHAVCQRRLAVFVLLERIFNDGRMQQRNYCDCHRQTYHEVDGNCDGEQSDYVACFSGHRQHERVENGADTQRGKHHRPEILLHASHCGVTAPHSLAEVFEVTIYHNDGIVHHHS